MDSPNGDGRRSGVSAAELEDWPPDRDVPEMILLGQRGSRKRDFGMEQEESSERLQLSLGSIDGDFDSKNFKRTNPCTVASFMPHHIICLLKALLEKHERKEVYDPNAEFRNALSTCPKPHLSVLSTVVAVFDKFVKKLYPASHIDQLPEMLAKLLIRRANVEHYLRDIFNGRAVPRPLKLYVTNIPERNFFKNITNNRTVRERPLSANTSIRSNEEEDSSSPNSWTQHSNNFRFHENWDGHSNYYSRRQHLKILLTEKEIASQSTINPESDVLLAPKPLHYRDDSRVQEEIRNAERFNPQFRGNSRRKRNHQSYSAKTKAHKKYSNSKGLDAFHKNSFSSRSSSDRDTFSNNSEDGQKYPCQCPDELSESIGREQIQSWNFTNTFDWFTDGRESRSVSSTDARLSNFDSKVLFTPKHCPWIQRKVENNRSEFGSEFGEEPTIVNKQSRPEYESMATTLILLKNNSNSIETRTNENSTHSGDSNALTVAISSMSSRHLEKDVQKVFQEQPSYWETVVIMESEKNMNRKGQKELKVEKLESLNLENKFAKTIAQNYEEFFQPSVPVNERYRTAKKLLARSTTPLKLKESGVLSDLSTINENETMDFESSSPGLQCPGLTNLTAIRNISRNDFPVSNIHELSSPELMLEYKLTKEEKKKLRNCIRMFKQEVRNRAANDGRHPIHSLYCRYKNTRAKLKLLEALLQKTKDLSGEFKERKKIEMSS